MRLLSILSLVLAAASAMAAEYFIPAAAHVAGANATFFQTDLRIVNLASAPATVELTFLPTGSDNSSAARIPVTIAARASMQLDDVVANTFGVMSGGGAIRISSTADLAITSRTYTTSPNAQCPGSFGQFIAAMTSSDAFRKSVIPAIRTSATPTTGFRTNVGLVNPSASTVTVTLKLRDAGSRIVGTHSTSLPPLSHWQTSAASAFAVATTVDNAFVEVEASAPLFAYASVVDNQSGDSVFVPAIEDTGTPASGTVIIARQWVFEPATIEVTAGTPVTLTMRAVDVDHGVGFSGVGPVICSPDQAGQCVLKPGEDVTITFTPASKGSFAFFCTRFCGSSADGAQSHATMRGTVVVK